MLDQHQLIVQLRGLCGLQCDYTKPLAFPGGTRGKESACQFRRCETQVQQSLVQEDPLKQKWQPTPVFLPRKFHGQRSLAGHSPWDLRVNHN